MSLNLYILYLSMLAAALMFLFLLYMLLRGKAWARVLFTFLILSGLYIGLFSKFNYTPIILAFISNIVTLADIVSLGLLWHPATTRWFKAMKGARHVDRGGKSAGSSEKNENAETDATVSAFQTTYSVISYKKLLKLLRFIRATYILVITQIITNIVISYNLGILKEITKPAISQNTTGINNMDRGISLFLLVILVISLVYFFIEMIIDKKLHIYPQRYIDKSYSPKMIYFLSFLYAFSFFTLNSWIACTFLKADGYRIIYYILMNIFVIFIIYKSMIQKIKNKKIWRNFWIVALCALPIMMGLVYFTKVLIAPYGMAIITEPVSIIINNVVSSS